MRNSTVAPSSSSALICFTATRGQTIASRTPCTQSSSAQLPAAVTVWESASRHGTQALSSTPPANGLSYRSTACAASAAPWPKPPTTIRRELTPSASRAAMAACTTLTAAAICLESSSSRWRSGTPRTTSQTGNSGVSNHCSVIAPPRAVQGEKSARGQIQRQGAAALGASTAGGRISAQEASISPCPCRKMTADLGCSSFM
mmetsp:Transcript_68947/g.201850  ORF Transcript_68947/g.201850 Transcript_68947/m.201850 type:complete len:202 (+) Transcript_68947:184-789(+)